jgi:RNA polymerase sigma-B factor
MPDSTAGRNNAARARRHRDTAVLWERVVSAENREASDRLREEIVLLNLPVAQSIARRYVARGIPLEDLEQVACLGLVKAVRGFDPALGKDFVSYAVPTISGEVKRNFRDFGWTVRPPRRVQELQARITSASNAFFQSLGRAARPMEMAAYLGVDVDSVLETMACTGAFNPASLDAPLGQPGSSESLGDLLRCGRDDFVEVENALLLRYAISTLSPRDVLILQRRFCEERTQQQIGDEIGVSQMQVSRMLARIIAKLSALVAPEADWPLTA